jgi:GntR family transcriptional regulator
MKGRTPGRTPLYAQREERIATGIPDGAFPVEACSPVFAIERTSYSAGDTPVDYEKLHYRGDLIRFTTRLARRKPAGPLSGGLE